MLLLITEAGLALQRRLKQVYAAAVVYSLVLATLVWRQALRRFLPSLFGAEGGGGFSRLGDAPGETPMTGVLVALYVALVSAAALLFVLDARAQRRVSGSAKKRCALPSAEEEERQAKTAAAKKKKTNEPQTTARPRPVTNNRKAVEAAEASLSAQEKEQGAARRAAVNERIRDMFLLHPSARASGAAAVLFVCGVLYLLFLLALGLQAAVIDEAGRESDREAAMARARRAAGGEGAGGRLGRGRDAHGGGGGGTGAFNGDDDDVGMLAIVSGAAAAVARFAFAPLSRWAEDAVLFFIDRQQYRELSAARRRAAANTGRSVNPYATTASGARGGLAAMMADAQWAEEMRAAAGPGGDAMPDRHSAAYETLVAPAMAWAAVAAAALGLTLLVLLARADSQMRLVRGKPKYDNTGNSNPALTAEALGQLASGTSANVSRSDLARKMRVLEGRDEQREAEATAQTKDGDAKKSE